jgi:hypothetical protein
MLHGLNVLFDSVRDRSGRTKGPPVHILNRLITTPLPRALRGWRAEALAAAALVGGLAGQQSGAY